MQIHEIACILYDNKGVSGSPSETNTSEEQKLPSLSQVTNPQLGSGIQNQIDTITR